MFELIVEELKKPEYQDLTDREAANALNAKEVIVRSLVDVVVVKTYAIKEGFFADIDEGCSSTDSAKRKLCKNVLAWFNDPTGKIGTVDVDDPTAQQMLLALKNYSIITQDQMSEMINFANKAVRWVDDIDFGTVGEGHVKSAREMM
jgi:hypothetical protein